MAEDMIERVARRLWDHSFDRMPDPPWEQTSELQKRFNRMLAREAIAEMREPTPEMQIAGAAVERAIALNSAEYRAGHVYRQMVDAALSPKQPGAT